MMDGTTIVASYTGHPSMINEVNCGTYVPIGNVGALEQGIALYYNLSENQRCEEGTRG